MFVNPDLGLHQDTPAHLAVERARGDTKGLAGIPTLRHSSNGCMWDKVEKYLQAAVSGLGLTMAASTRQEGPLWDLTCPWRTEVMKSCPQTSSGPILWTWDTAPDRYWGFSTTVEVPEAVQRSLTRMLQVPSCHPEPDWTDSLLIPSKAQCTSWAMVSHSSAPWAFPSLGCTHVDAHTIPFWDREKAAVFQISAIKSFCVLHLSETCWTGQLQNSYRGGYQSIFQSIATISRQQTAAFFILLIHPLEVIHNSLGLTPVLNTCFT